MNPPSMSPLTKSLIEELERAPESVRREVLAFLRYLRARGAGSNGREDAHALLPLARGTTVIQGESGRLDSSQRPPAFEMPPW